MDISSLQPLLQSHFISDNRILKKGRKMKISLILLALAAVVLVCSAHPAPDGGITYGAEHDNQGGVRPSVHVGQEWVSADKRTRAELHGNWERTYGGRMHGDRMHNVGFKISHRFR